MSEQEIMERLRAIDAAAMRDKLIPTDCIVVNAIEQLIVDLECDPS